MKEITGKLIKFRDERGWNKHHMPGELARSLMIEAAELNRLFQWPLMNKTFVIEELKDELADIYIYLAYLCHQFSIDIDEAVNSKIKKNAIKYPVE
jgi:NTP pyrophosphatase (non-canonical NTP hydrolase)